MGKNLKTTKNLYSVLGCTPGFPESTISPATTVMLSQSCHTKQAWMASDINGVILCFSPDISVSISCCDKEDHEYDLLSGLPFLFCQHL